MKRSIGAKPLILTNPVLIIGTYDKDGKPNLMNAAWGGIACSSPPCISVSMRKATYSHGCMKAKKAFTVGIPSEKLVVESDFVGIASGRNMDKFEKLGLTHKKSELVDAPYADEFPMVLHCRLKIVNELGLHTQFVGEIVDITVDEDKLNEKGIDVEKIKPFVYSHADHKYYGLGKTLGKAFTIGKKE